jgi:hypothetical protein
LSAITEVNLYGIETRENVEITYLLQINCAESDENWEAAEISLRVCPQSADDDAMRTIAFEDYFDVLESMPRLKISFVDLAHIFFALRGECQTSIELTDRVLAAILKLGSQLTVSRREDNQLCFELTLGEFETQATVSFDDFTKVYRTPRRHALEKAS